MQAENTVHAVILYSFLQKRLGVHFPFLDNHNIANKKHKRNEPLIKLTNQEYVLLSLRKIILLIVKSSILRYYQAPFGLIKSQMDSLDFFRYMHKEKSAPL